MIRPDAHLLDDWRPFHDREAMDQLIRRHINFVYGAARRMMRNDAAAEDVTQAVFMLLIQKSPRITSDLALARWLHRTTRFACANARRMESRRIAREHRAVRSESIESTSITQIDARDELDDAIASLASRDRVAVLMCILQQRTYREAGDAIGMSEEATRKRVTRALARLRDRFRGRGLALDDAMLGACAIPAPTALLQSTLKITPAINLVSRCLPSAQIAEKVTHTMLMLKMKFAAAACLAVLASAALTTIAIHSASADSEARPETRLATIAPDDFAVKIDDKVDLKLLGVSDSSADKNGWHDLAGAKIDDPRGPFAREKIDITEDNKRLVFHLSCDGELPSFNFKANHAQYPHLFDLTDGPSGMFVMIYFLTKPTDQSADVEIMLGDGEWTRIAEAKVAPDNVIVTSESKEGNFTFTPVLKSPHGAARIYMSHDAIEGAWHVSAIDADGKSHECGYNIQEQAGKIITDVMDFDVAPEEVVSFVVERRPYNRRVLVKNIALDAAHPTKPQITVEPIEPK